MRKLIFTLVVFTGIYGFGQKNELKVPLNSEGTNYLKFTFLNQTWLRYNQSNPSTTVMGEKAKETFDIGLRRTRMQFFGQINDHVFLYTQFGMNNFNFLSSNSGNRKLQAFFHDALGEYIVFKNKNWLKFGGGLSICNGLSRFTQPSVSSIMSLDVPVFAQSTVDQIDEFARKLSFYARGQVGHFDYRVIVSDPFPINTNGQTTPVLGKDAVFTTIGHHKQFQGLFIYNFFESENHTTPYMTGTALGSKKILNLEAGFIAQKNATWNLSNDGQDTLFNDLLHLSVAAYLDMPLDKEKGNAINAYLGYFNLDYGKNYIRNNGIMNPANGSTSTTLFNGAGNAYPMFGTGSVVYGQFGYLLKKNLLKEHGTLMPFATFQYAQLQKLKDNVMVFDLGINWLIQGHNAKLSLDLQNRPVFEYNSTGEIHETMRKNCLILQYQVFI